MGSEFGNLSRDDVLALFATDRGQDLLKAFEAQHLAKRKRLEEERRKQAHQLALAQQQQLCKNGRPEVNDIAAAVPAADEKISAGAGISKDDAPVLQQSGPEKIEHVDTVVWDEKHSGQSLRVNHITSAESGKANTCDIDGDVVMENNVTALSTTDSKRASTSSPDEEMGFAGLEFGFPFGLKKSAPAATSKVPAAPIRTPAPVAVSPPVTSNVSTVANPHLPKDGRVVLVTTLGVSVSDLDERGLPRGSEVVLITDKSGPYAQVPHRFEEIPAQQPSKNRVSKRRNYRRETAQWRMRVFRPELLDSGDVVYQLPQSLAKRNSPYFDQQRKAKKCRDDADYVPSIFFEQSLVEEEIVEEEAIEEEIVEEEVIEEEIIEEELVEEESELVTVSPIELEEECVPTGLVSPDISDEDLYAEDLYDTCDYTDDHHAVPISPPVSPVLEAILEEPEEETEPELAADPAAEAIQLFEELATSYPSPPPSPILAPTSQDIAAETPLPFTEEPDLISPDISPASTELASDDEAVAFIAPDLTALDLEDVLEEIVLETQSIVQELPRELETIYEDEVEDLVSELEFTVDEMLAESKQSYAAIVAATEEPAAAEVVLHAAWPVEEVDVEVEVEEYVEVAPHYRIIPYVPLAALFSPPVTPGVMGPAEKMLGIALPCDVLTPDTPSAWACADMGDSGYVSGGAGWIEEEEVEEEVEEVEEVEDLVEEPVEETAGDIVEDLVEETVAEAVEEVVEEPVAQVVAEPVEETVEEVVEHVVEDIVAEPVEEVVEELVEALVEVVEEVVAVQVEEVVEEAIEEDVEEVVEVVAEQVEELIEEPVAELIVEPVVESVAEPVVESIAMPVEEPVEEPIEEPTLETIEEAIEELVEETVEELVEEPTLDTVEEAVEELAEEPTLETVEEAIVDNTEEEEEEEEEESDVEEITRVVEAECEPVRPSSPAPAVVEAENTCQELVTVPFTEPVFVAAPILEEEEHEEMDEEDTDDASTVMDDEADQSLVFCGPERPPHGKGKEVSLALTRTASQTTLPDPYTNLTLTRSCSSTSTYYDCDTRPSTPSSSIRTLSRRWSGASRMSFNTTITVPPSRPGSALSLCPTNDSYSSALSVRRDLYTPARKTPQLQINALEWLHPTEPSWSRPVVREEWQLKSPIILPAAHTFTIDHDDAHDAADTQSLHLLPLTRGATPLRRQRSAPVYTSAPPERPQARPYKFRSMIEHSPDEMLEGINELFEDFDKIAAVEEDIRAVCRGEESVLEGRITVVDDDDDYDAAIEPEDPVAEEQRKKNVLKRLRSRASEIKKKALGKVERKLAEKKREKEEKEAAKAAERRVKEQKKAAEKAAKEQKKTAKKEGKKEKKEKKTVSSSASSVRSRIVEIF